MFALPGAFTPTCSRSHLPGYVEHAQEIRSRGVELIACLLQVIHAVYLRQDATLIEGVDVDFLARVLEAAKEMAGESDAGDGQLQATTDGQVDHAQADGVAGAAIDDAV